MMTLYKPFIDGAFEALFKGPATTSGLSATTYRTAATVQGNGLVPSP